MSYSTARSCLLGVVAHYFEHSRDHPFLVYVLPPSLLSKAHIVERTTKYDAQKALVDRLLSTINFGEHSFRVSFLTLILSRLALT